MYYPSVCVFQLVVFNQDHFCCHLNFTHYLWYKDYHMCYPFVYVFYIVESLLQYFEQLYQFWGYLIYWQICLASLFWSVSVNESCTLMVKLTDIVMWSDNKT